MIDNKIKFKTSPHQIDFETNKKNEEDHIAKIDELLEKKRYGDWELVAQMCGIKVSNAKKSFTRVNSKYHTEAFMALETIVEQRTNLLNN